MLEIVITMLLMGTGSFSQRITTHKLLESLLILIICFFTYFTMRRTNKLIKESLRESYPPRQISYSSRVVLVVLAPILFIFGVINLIYNVFSLDTHALLYWIITGIWIPLATTFLLFSLYNPINDKLSLENIKKPNNKYK
jgi:hypothetical protein